VQFTLSLLPKAALDRWDEVIQCMKQLGVKKLCDMLLLFGTRGWGSRLHVDWQHAWNVAIGLCVPRGTVVALWLCFFAKPGLQEKLNAFLQSDAELRAKFPLGLLVAFPAGAAVAAPTKLHVEPFTAEEMRRIQAALPDYAYIVEQHSGYPLTIPVGALHAVVNTETCIKFAADYYGNPATAALSHRAIARPMFGPLMVEDNMMSARVSLENVMGACF
jgi:hypothetical protein